MKLTFICLCTLFLSHANAAAVEKSIAVRGNCLHEVYPDKSSVVVTAEFQDKEASKASRLAQEQYNKFREAIIKKFKDDAKLETAEYSVNEIIDWRENKRISLGYKARMGLKITTTKMNILGEVIQIASQMGVRDVGQLYSFVSDQKLKIEKEACIEEAFLNARQKADRLAKVAGVKISNVVTIREEGINYDPTPMPRAMTLRKGMAVAQEDSAPALDMQAKSLEVSVEVVFGI